jgi:hypothetical protein
MERLVDAAMTLSASSGVVIRATLNSNARVMNVFVNHQLAKYMKIRTVVVAEIVQGLRLSHLTLALRHDPKVLLQHCHKQHQNQCREQHQSQNWEHRQNH